MEKAYFLCAVFILCCLACDSQDEILTPEAELLFKNASSTLTNSEKNEIFTLTQFQVAKNGKQFQFKDGTASGFPFDVVVYPVDLNRDGKEEIALQFGNSFTSGADGVSYHLFIKDTSKRYTSSFGFPGVLLLATTKNMNYPDILVGGAGFSPYPVWRWNGSAYEYFDTVERSVVESMPPVFITDASKAYVAALEDQ
ncbi:hypothetical protein ATE92_2223 [Ulvibacter sp. MAR_2010_11]|uniref:hypothetical protein n=1 Tax=Ulvibacter sp. MAR_2010_11 TaxID=1250229 RepID=UPI000CC38DCB|nr:hypothetical protein [Ulvibacter sp. MAR_2010_11]PKA84053.1 hypothetical protein ATE92_2223 [Ulvibacter sp. MAR_2010_11]